VVQEEGGNLNMSFEAGPHERRPVVLLGRMGGEEVESERKEE
jgi:hypothetical protein